MLLSLGNNNAFIHCKWSSVFCSVKSFIPQSITLFISKVYKHILYNIYFKIQLSYKLIYCRTMNAVH